MQTDIQWPVPGTEWMEKGAVCRERERGLTERKAFRAEDRKESWGGWRVVECLPQL